MGFFCKTKSELVSILGTTRPTFDRISKLPGHPEIGRGEKAWNIKQWRNFFLTNVRQDIRVEKYNAPASPRDIARTIKEEAQAKKAQREMQILDRDYLPRTEINEGIDSANMIVKRELRKVFEHELPPIQEGMSAAEIRKENAKALDRIFEKLPQKFKGADK